MGRLTPVVRRATRWALVVALALPVVLLPAGFALGQGAPPVKVKATQSVHSVSYLPVYVADKQGFFKKNGLDVEVTVTQGGGPDLQALLSGGVEFWFGGPINQLLAYGQNRDQRTLSVVAFFSNLGINLVMRKDTATRLGLSERSPIADKLKALKGLVIGVTRPGALTDMVVKYYLAKAGIDPKDVTVIGIGSGATQLAALEQRRVDVAVDVTPTSEEAVRRGAAIMLVHNFAGEDPNLRGFLQQTLVVLPAYAQRQPDVVRRMVRSFVEAEQWIGTRPPAELAEIAHPFMPAIDRSLLATTIAAGLSGFVSPRIAQSGFDKNQELLMAAGVLKEMVPWTQLATNDFLPQ